MRHASRSPLVFLMLLAFFPGGALHAIEREDDCRRFERQREQLVRQLRRPHSASQANRLHERLRKVRLYIAHQCR